MGAEKTLDVVCLGRAAVDLYGEQLGSSLEDVQSFAKYIGGCAANIAVGAARLGLRSAMITKVGDEHLGRFVRRTLADEGVDVRHVRTEPGRLTGVVLLGLKDEHTFPLIFLRENVADMALTPEDVDPELIDRSRVLVLTGTHLSQPGVLEASRAALGYARARGATVVLDLDYRPVLWRMSGPGSGEVRYVPSERFARTCQPIIADCDLVVGTEEELRAAAGVEDTLVAAKTLRQVSDAVFVVKRGERGCVVLEGDIPDRLEDGLVVPAPAVEVLNVLGAGDAFLAGFLRGYVDGEPWRRCAELANACGALVVSRHGCAPAMPTRPELDDNLARRDSVPRPDRDSHLAYLHRVTTRHGVWPEVCALAFDHRWQLEQLADERGASRERLPKLKTLIAEGALRAAEALDLRGRGVLVDDRFGKAALRRLADQGFWVARPVEVPGSRPLAFEAGPEVGLTLRSRPREHVVKCLVYYHPDDEAGLRTEQEARLRQLFGACVMTERELLLEVILPKGMPEDETTLARALDRLYDQGIAPDWWKLPPPRSVAAWQHLSTVLDAKDPHCRGVLLLGLEAPENELRHSFQLAAGQRWCKGFAVGRTIFAAPAGEWLAGRLGDQALVREVASAFGRVVALWRERGPR